MPAWYKVDVAIKINSATNSYIFMNSLPLLGSYKMRDWLQSQKKQESTKNNKYFCMDLSSFGENAVKIVLKALLTGNFERGCKRDRDVSNLVRNFNIGYLNKRYGEATGFIVKKPQSNGSKNNGGHKRHNNNRN